MTENSLVERLRGRYRVPIADGLGPVGGGEPDNPNEFVRTFPTPPIQHEAAAALEAAAATIAELRGQVERLRDQDAPMADGGEHEMTAAEDALAWLLIERVVVPDDVSYTPRDASRIISAALEDRERDAERQAAELSDISAAIGSPRFMDPPDGGSVSLAEQVRRMAEALSAAERALASKDGVQVKALEWDNLGYAHVPFEGRYYVGVYRPGQWEMRSPGMEDSTFPDGLFGSEEAAKAAAQAHLEAVIRSALTTPPAGDALRKALREALRQRDEAHDEVKKLCSEIAELRFLSRAGDALREALEFYANPANWIDTPSWDGDPDCFTSRAIPVIGRDEHGRICDCGDTARRALAALHPATTGGGDG